MNDDTIQISQHAFEALLRQIGRGGSGYNPGPDDPEPHGPGAPVIRQLVEALVRTAGRGGSGYYPGPDDPEPHGPGAPVIRQLLEALARQAGRGGSGYNPGPDDPEPHGPGAPVIRQLLAQLRHRAEPEPAPWRVLAEVLREALGPQPEPWRLAALNPQPLPPRVVLVAILTDEVIRRANLLFDLAAALPEGARERAMAGAASEVAGYAADYDGDLCPVWRRWPFPPRKEDLTAPLDRSEIAVAAAQLRAAGRDAADRRLGEAFTAAANQLLQGAGAARGFSYEDATLVT